VLGLPAAALVWDAAGRPLPSFSATRPALAEAGSARPDSFDGRTAIIIDGDTIALGRERVRILNIDAPESHEPRCERELIAGLRAKERLAQLVRVAEVAIARDGRDRYGRTLATLSAEGRDIGNTLVREGLALPWRDGSEARAARIRHWCG
jgi:endonuclease YncB( thermonuclease family)